MLREDGPTRLRDLVQEVAMCSGKKWITVPRVYFAMEALYRDFFIVFRIVVEQQTASEKEDKV